MSAILEAYWLLAAKRFVDNVCMSLDKKIMGAVAHRMQGAVGVCVGVVGVHCCLCT